MHPHRLIAPSSTEKAALVALYTASFTASDGPDEGQAVGALVRDILAQCLPDGAMVYQTTDATGLRAAVLFTPLVYGAGGGPRAMLLSPMAVTTDFQRQGLGQSLLAVALADLRAQGVDLVLTYGDPAFYGKSGFLPADPATLPAPYPLSMPQGWQGVALAGGSLPALQGPCRCVAPFENPAMW